MAKLLPPDDEALLCALWARCSSLDGKDTETLCKLIMRALRRCFAPELLALRGSDDLRDVRDQYINDFLIAKVLDHSRFTDSPLYHVGALVRHFRRFLLNAIEAKKRRLKNEESVEEPIVEADEDGGSVSCLDSYFDEPSDSNREATFRHAQEFARTLEKRHQVLLLSYCANEPVFTVAKRYNIASAAHHAGKLGITKKAGSTPPAYGKTLIGRWMTQVLGINFAAGSASDFKRAMEALCAASFELRADLEAGLSHA